MKPPTAIRRIDVMGRCQPPCPSCVACRDVPPAPLERVLERADCDRLTLGGGDATAWPHLDALLARRAATGMPAELWIEAPARSLPRTRIEALSAAGVSGIRVQIEAGTADMARALRVGDGEQVVRDIEEVGLGLEILLCARPRTLSSLAGLAQRLVPRTCEIEVVRQDWGKEPVPLHPDIMERVLAAAPNLRFTGKRLPDRGYLPPCAVPSAWARTPSAWKALLHAGDGANDVLAACAECELATSCRWKDRDALPEGFEVTPIRGSQTPWDVTPAMIEVPAWIAAKRPTAPLVCVAPWTTMEALEPDGLVYQCCNEWTWGSRGDANTTTLDAIWNGPGYQQARRQMADEGTVMDLCREICPRLYDKEFSESVFKIKPGSDAFVANQLLMAEDIAERREIMRARPLQMTLCPSTYCNYDCIMCQCGRTPRRELPADIWDQIPEFLPTLESLTLIGGEPLADPRTMELLKGADVLKYPDVRVNLVTNGSLLTPRTLSHLQGCAFGAVVVSVNAGDAETYARVQRGIPLEDLLRNIDALMAFRSAHRRPFGIVLSFVVQPTSIDTIIPFAELARVRGLAIRLLPMNISAVPELDFYLNDDVVAHMLRRLDEFADYCRATRREWLVHAFSARDSLLGEVGRRKAALNAG